MTRLDSQDAIQQFLGRFSRFYDGLLVKVHLDLPHSGQHTAAVDLLAQEVPNSDGAWYVVTLDIQGLAEYKFVEGRVSNRVLSSGIMIHPIAGKIFVDLAPCSEEPQGEADIWQSYQYVAGREASYSVREFAE